MQLATKYNRPTIVARLNEEGYIRGSARGLNQSELKSFKNFLGESGFFEYTIGHDNAFGASIPNANLKKFHTYANEFLENYDFGDNVYEVEFERSAYDKDIKDIIFDLAGYVDVWGQMNSEPLIAVKNIVVRASDIQCIGKNSDTLKIEKNGITYIKFFARDLIQDLRQFPEVSLTVVGTANLNTWMGHTTPQIFIKDVDIKDGAFAF